MARIFSPMANSLNVFMLHATNARQVTWGMECSDSRSINCDLLVERRKVREIMHAQVRVVLIVDELLNQSCESWFINLIGVDMFHCILLLLG